MRYPHALLLLVLLLVAPAAQAVGTTRAFDFETTASLADAALTGNLANFVTTNSLTYNAGATGHGQQGLTFIDRREPYESLTYDLPAGLKTGTVSLWFKEDFVTSSTDPTWGLSFLIEDAANPQDWGALEVSNFGLAPYVPAAYFATEGSVDRAKANDRYDSSILRTPNVWHQLVFDIRTTGTLISVDGSRAIDVAGPGSEVTTGTARTLRLRILGNTPSLGGRKNYRTSDNATTTTVAYPAAAGRVWFDDIQAQAVTPTAASSSLTFEQINDVPDYDVPTNFGVAPTNNPALNGFLNKFELTDVAAHVHGGAQAAYFAPGGHRLRQLSWDLQSLYTTPGTITLYFYDTVGASSGNNRFGGSIVLQSGTEPGNWIAVEITNFSFPSSGDPTPGAPNYYLAQGIHNGGSDPANGLPHRATFYSRYFGNRSVGWHKVEIQLGNTESRILVDGVENSGGYYTTNPPNVTAVTGPGLNSNPKLVILADSASGGGLGPNFVALGELYQLYDNSAYNPYYPTPYTLFDDLTIPVTSAPNAAGAWQVYE